MTGIGSKLRLHISGIDLALLVNCTSINGMMYSNGKIYKDH